MKKYLLAIATAVALPLLSFAAYSDVTLTTSARLSVGGYTLLVSGTSAVVQSIAVNSNSFSVTLLPSSLFAVSSASKQVLSVDSDANVTGNQCLDDKSILTLSASTGSAVTVTVTPSSSTCTGTATNSGSSNTGGNGAPGGGGGGGGGGSVPIITTAKVPATTVPVSTVVQQMAPVSVSIPVYVFVKVVGPGATNADVKALQQILNADPDTRVASTGVGSVGKETNYFGPATTKAISKFQVKYKIAKPGDSGYGTLGPKTRAKLNEISGKGTVSVSAAVSASTPSSASDTADVAKQLNDSLKLLQALQAQLKTLK